MPRIGPTAGTYATGESRLLVKGRDFVLDRDAFLRQEVESATPAKLRWMLIRKAIGHCHSIEQYWKNEDWHAGMEWLIAVQDILNELLAGITDKQNVFAKQDRRCLHLPAQGSLRGWSRSKC